MMLQEWLKASKEVAALQNKVEDKITKIIGIICITFGQKLDTWYVSGAAEGEVGNLSSCFYDEWVQDLTIETKGSYKSRVIIDKDGVETELDNGFPMRWIEADLADVKEELVKGRGLLEEREAKANFEKAEKAKAKKAEKEAAKTEALKKLTKEERKALGL